MSSLPAWLSLAGRTALVTGAGSPTGIGMATARALGELGARVEVTATTARIHERVAELGADGIDAVGHVIDLTVEVAVAGMLTDIVARRGAVDIVVNNAGMVSTDSVAEQGDIGDMALTTWRAGLERNLDTAFLVTRGAVGVMRARTWGRIVNVSSVTGPVMAMREEPAYAAAKAAMVGLTRALAVDLADAGITVNAVAPGWIETGSQLADEARQALATPIGRSARPQEVAAAIAWLCSPGAAYVTGQCLVIDGGNSIAEERGPVSR